MTRVRVQGNPCWIVEDYGAPRYSPQLACVFFGDDVGWVVFAGAACGKTGWAEDHHVDSMEVGIRDGDLRCLLRVIMFIRHSLRNEMGKLFKVGGMLTEVQIVPACHDKIP